jgi:U32 family peptidase
MAKTPTVSVDSLRPPELMAPAGDWDCAKAAVENGADAVYFGLQSGMNARAGAVNFTPAALPELMALLRGRGVRGYLALNTLVFPRELDDAERAVRLAAMAGVDAVLVQDLGLARLIGRLCPELPLHASTQMTLSSAECIEQVESLGIRRVVLPRELSIAEITAIRRRTTVELEAFVHGALCISYSGQCLASLTLGGRSANRGQCAQPCRLPYELVCDGKTIDLGEKRYPLSPHDLAAYDRLPELIASGIAAVKIEGRMKTAEYVAVVTGHYRAAIDAVAAGRPVETSPQQVAEMEAAFSRGFGHGWLDGNDYRSLVSGTTSAKRGILLGAIESVRGCCVRVRLAVAVHRGDGVVFESARGTNVSQGGRVYEVFRDGNAVSSAESGDVVDLAFGRNDVDVGKLRPGREIWKTDDPRLQQRLRKSFAGRPRRRLPLDLAVEAAVGKPLGLHAELATGVGCEIASLEPLAEARQHVISQEVLAEQFGRLGNTAYELRRLDARIIGRPMVPLSVLGAMRREMIERLETAAAAPPVRTVSAEPVLPLLRAEAAITVGGASKRRLRRGQTSATGVAFYNSNSRALLDKPGVASNSSSYLHVLCRSLVQLEAALESGALSVIADFAELSECRQAVRLARAGRAMVLLAAPRIHKPGESDVFRQLAECRPDGLLVRNLAGLAFCREALLPAVADFSLNAANELTVHWLLNQGAERVTVSYDLSMQQLCDLAAGAPASQLEVVVHRYTPMFHSAHCLFCALLSSGKNGSRCGRVCEKHEVRLRDRRGVEHPLWADSQCRNTLFHAEAQDMTERMPALKQQGFRHFRVELLDDRGVKELLRRVTGCQSSIEE